MKRRAIWHIRSRGASGTLKQTSYFLVRFLRNSTASRLANFCLAKAAKALRRDRLRSLPYRYTIDPSNICNLHCVLCPTGLGILKRQRGRIKLDDFRRLVDQIAPQAYLLELYNWGEPFLHPGIFDMIRYAHERRIVVRLSSNLNHFSPEMARKAVAAGLDAIIVSLDGAEEASYQAYRKGGKLETVLRNLGYLVEAKRAARAANPLIVTRMLVNRHNEGEGEELRRLVHSLGADVFLVGDIFVDTSDAGQRREWLPSDSRNSAYRYHDDQDQIENVWHCSDLWESMTINWDGGVSPCCWLHDARHDFANALQQPVREIWNGEAYVSARQTFAADGPDADAQKVICNECRGHPRYLKA